MNDNNLINLKDRTQEERQAIAKKGGMATKIRWEEIKKQREELWKNEEDFYSTCKQDTILKTIKTYLTQTKDIIVQKPHYIGKEDGYNTYSNYEVEKGKEEHQLILNILDNAKDEDIDNSYRWSKLLTSIIKSAEDNEIKRQKMLLSMDLKREEIELKKQIKLKELELKERDIVVKETLIKFKNKGVIDGKILTKEQEQNINLALNNELVKAIEQEQK